ncbi:MAG TPA: transcription termination/antitermination protein NusG [Armatimonadota bacterium]|jgi:transcriptional antiterminator NusG
MATVLPVHWYAIHTYSGHENKVATNIQRRADSLGMGEKIRRTFIPMEQEIKVVNGKPRTVNKKVFPGYVLIEMVLDDSTWHLVKNTTGVTGFISSGNPPVPVALQQHEVQRIVRELEEGPQKPKVEFQKGDVVRVLSGPFADLTGKIDEVNLDRQKLRVLIELFGRDTPVELEFPQVEKSL